MSRGGERRRLLLVATRSAHKLRELGELLDLPGSELISLAAIGVDDDAPEPFASFEENAVAKARFYAAASGLPTLADDSGLEVDALGGGPGVRTRRYAGEDATDDENNAKLLRELAGVPVSRRAARYVCVLAFVGDAAGDPTVRRGTFAGRIALAPRGRNGFGYDPIFEPFDVAPGGRTVAQMTRAEKNAVSHRAVAARQMRDALRERGY